MSSGIGETLEWHTVCSLACRRWQSATPLWVRVRSQIADWTQASQLELCNHRGWILPATLVEHDSGFLYFASNLPQAYIGMLACNLYMPTNQPGWFGLERCTSTTRCEFCPQPNPPRSRYPITTKGLPKTEI